MNQAFFELIHGLVRQWPGLDSLAIFLARDAIFVLLVGLTFWLFWQAGRAGLAVYLKILGAGGLAWLVSAVLKLLITAPRPFAALDFTPLIGQEAGNSFPSGHTALAFGLAFGYLFFAPPKNKSQYIFIFSLFTLSFLIGLARVYAGVHWPLDILGGIGAGWLALVVVRVFNSA